MRTPIVSLGIIITIVLALLYSYNLNGADSPQCSNIRMFPSYARILAFNQDYTPFASKYSLYLYREQGKDTKPTKANNYQLNGLPVLFIPGNAGSYKQARSIAAKTAELYFNHQYSGDNVHRQNLDFFTADFNEDFTAFHGRTMLDQAEYLNEAIKFILHLYNDNTSSHQVRSVMIIGHSMGGIVSRVMMTLPNYVPDSIKSIITLSSPHAKAPLTFDSDIMKIYRAINDFWTLGYGTSHHDDVSLEAYNRIKDVSLISITGGILDNILPADYTSIEGLVPQSNGFTVFTSGIENVWTSIDHLAVVWCDQLRTVISNILLDITDNRVPEGVYPLSKRMEIFRKHLLTFEPLDLNQRYIVDKPENFHHYQGNLSILSHSPLEVVICNDTCYDISNQSSKIPNNLYGMKLQYPDIYINGNPDTLVGNIMSVNVSLWLFKRIKLSSNLLTTVDLNIDNSLISYNIKLSKPLISRQYNKIETKWHDSATFNLNYHGTSPFISHNENLKLDIWNTSGEAVDLEISINLWVSMKLLIIRYRLTIISYGLIIVLLVFQQQMKQKTFSSFTKTLSQMLTIKNIGIYVLASLVINLLINIPVINKVINLIFWEDENLLILGVKNFQILNLLFMTLSITFNYLTSYLVEFLTQKKFPISSYSRKFRLIISCILLVLTLTYLPYQVIYIICFIIQLIKLFRTDHHHNFNITMFLMMLWILPINIPILIVLVHNITINWRTSFSSHHNILSILPIFTFTNLSNYKFKQNKLIEVFVWYWISYNWVYGSIHTYFMFHLFNYFCVILLIDYFVDKYL